MPKLPNASVVTEPAVASITAHENQLSLWPAFGLGLGVAVSNGMARFSYALVLPSMREDLHWSYAEAGWLNAANAIGYVLGAVSGYLLLRRVRPSQLFTVGLLLTLTILSITGLGAQLSWLTATRLIAGIGAAWVFACGGALVAARYQGTPALRGTATGLYFAGGGFGIAIAGLAVNPTLAHLGSSGWPEAWLVLGALAALTSIWPLLEAKRTVGSANAPSSGALNLHGLIPSLLSYFTFACGYIVYMTFIFAWIRDQHLSWQFGTVVWLLLGGSVAASPFVWRRALDTWNPAITLAVSCATMLLGTLLPVSSVAAPSMLASAACFGLGMFIAPSAVAVLVRRTQAPNQWAKGLTFFTVVFSVGQAIGPMFAGWIADHSSLKASLMFGAVLLALASCLALIGLRKVSARL